jgi:hypothetical protein
MLAGLRVVVKLDMRQTQDKNRKSRYRGLTSVQAVRARSVRERSAVQLSELQRRVIRAMVNRPGLTIKEYADGVLIDRSSVSRWINHDPAFQAALEEARSAPQAPLTAEAIFAALAAMDNEERRKVAVALRGDGRAGYLEDTGSGIAEIDNLERRIRNEEPGGQRGKLFAKIFELFCLAGDLFQVKGFDGGRLVDPKGVLSRLIDEEEEELNLYRMALWYGNQGRHPVEGQSKADGDGGISTDVLELDIKERRVILETSYRAKDG